MKLKNPIKINNFTGVSNDVSNGFYDVRNIDIDTITNCAIVGNKTVETDDVDIANPRYGATDGTNIYISDSDGVIWDFTAATAVKRIGNIVTETNRGLVCWKGYLFSFRDTKIDVMNMTTKAWTNNWQTINTATIHKALYATDDRVYFCNGNYVDGIYEIDGEAFDPSNAGTYGTTSLDMPSNETTLDIAEIGNKLAIATENKIYPWDRTATSFDPPIVMTYNIDLIYGINNLIYIFPEDTGEIYITDMTTINKINQIPQELSKTYLGETVTFNYIDRYKNGLLLGINNKYISGVWYLDIFKNRLSLHAKSLDATPYTSISIKPIVGDIFGWSNDTDTTGVATISTNNPYTNYEAYLISKIILLGSKNFPVTTNKIEVEFLDPLYTTDKYKIYYREELNGSWTLIATQAGDASKTTSVFEHNMLVDANKIQIKIEMASSTHVSTTKCKLKEIRIS